MIKRVAVFIMLAGGYVFAERPIDDVLYDAVRYGDTEERRAAKKVAREELDRRMPDSLRAAMRWIHGDNVMMNVLVMAWIESQPAEIVTPVMLEFLSDAREDTRRQALFFLGFKPTPEHADKVMPFLEQEKTRGAALRTLGKWKISGARPAAERWLAEGHERVRVVAANALRDIGDPAAIPALTRALEDPLFTVRNTAARAILILAKSDTSLIPASAPAQRMLDRIRADAGLLEADHDFAVEGKFFTP